ncbi:hypothetical protein [Leptospira noguchii]|uniref:hypothetical protein n=1 Tax=Leptospira noguchii TaxID=28182 RepID=UPI0007749D8B|nr:hypothetical protein [Leptospira noguchii]
MQSNILPIRISIKNQASNLAKRSLNFLKLWELPRFLTMIKTGQWFIDRPKDIFCRNYHFFLKTYHNAKRSLRFWNKLKINLIFQNNHQTTILCKNFTRQIVVFEFLETTHLNPWRIKN